MQELTKEDNFTDVTIVSGDELLDYQVHKFVLSAVSPVFKEILLNNPHEHPLIYLNGVKEQELQFLFYTSEEQLFMTANWMPFSVYSKNSS